MKKMELNEMKWKRINSGDDPAEIFECKENKKIISVLPTNEDLYHIFLEDTVNIGNINKLMFVNYGQILNELGFNPWTKE